jgi:hypothetical protein
MYTKYRTVQLNLFNYGTSKREQMLLIVFWQVRDWFDNTIVYFLFY